MQGLQNTTRGIASESEVNMSHNLDEAFSLHRAMQLAMDFENEAMIDPKESEHTVAFKRDVLSVLRKHGVVAADLRRPVVGDGIWTLFQYLRGNPEMPWNVLVLLRDWDSRYSTTGYDFVAVWIEQQEFQGC